MFLDVLDLLYGVIDTIISSWDSATLFTVGDRDITFWNLLLGFFIISLIFTFFLVPRGGSVTESINNFERGANISRDRKYSRDRRAESDNRRAESTSYETYAANRSRKEDYSRRYINERRSRK